MKRLCTICARGGSKGVKNKNIRVLAGKPLLAHSILQAKETNLFAGIAVSSDGDAILETADKWGATFLVKRPTGLAGDEVPKIPAIRHCVREIELRRGEIYDIIVDLDVSSPFRTAGDIRQAVKLLEEKGVSNLITGTPSRRSPYFNLVEVGNDGVARLSKHTPVPILRRQDAPLCYDMNASIYVWTRETLFKKDTVFNEDTLLYVMPEARSVDIDTEFDLEIAKLLAEKMGTG